MLNVDSTFTSKQNKANKRTILGKFPGKFEAVSTVLGWLKKKNNSDFAKTRDPVLAPKNNLTAGNDYAMHST